MPSLSVAVPLSGRPALAKRPSSVVETTGWWRVHHRPTATNNASHSRVGGHRRRAVANARNGTTWSREDNGPWDVLLEYTRADVAGTASTAYLQTKASRSALRHALLQAASSTNDSIGWYPPGHPGHTTVLLGIVASDIRLACRSLRDYCQALQVAYIPPTPQGFSGPLPSITGSVYIRYNSASELCTVSRYTGRDRGVLVQFGTVQVGHLPLGLLDEEKKAEDPLSPSHRL